MVEELYLCDLAAEIDDFVTDFRKCLESVGRSEGEDFLSALNLL